MNRPESQWGIVLRQLRKRREALFGLFLVLGLFLVALFAPLLASDRPVLLADGGRIRLPALMGPHAWRRLRMELGENWRAKARWVLNPPVPFSPTEHNLDERLLPPGRRHWLGTDDRGRDVLSRLIHGSRTSLSVGFVAVSIYILLGVLVGSLAGYYGGWVDALVSRLIEVMICFPTFVLILVILAFLRPSIYNIMIVIGITGWTGVARLIRGEFLKFKEQEFAVAARALGCGAPRVIFRHILPNAVAPALVSATFGVAAAILVESALSFLGFGVPPPTPSWGETLSLSFLYMDFAWWLVIFPGAAIFATITAYNMVGEALRDAIDPRLRT